MIRVLVNGALGRMGSEVCKKVYSEADLAVSYTHLRAHET